MKVSREIRAMPWPEPYQGERQDFNVTLAWPVVDGERLLVACFVRNRRNGALRKTMGRIFGWCAPNGRTGRQRCTGTKVAFPGTISTGH